MAENTGCFLTFPSFMIEVNDSSDCVVSGIIADPSHQVHFNAHFAGCVSTVPVTILVIVICVVHPVFVFLIVRKLC